VEIRKSYLAMIKAFAGGWDAMTGALGMSRDALENRIYERKGQGVLVETAMQLQAFSGTTYFAEAVAAASGGAFVKLPLELVDGNEALSMKFHRLVAELGEFSRRYAEAIADGEIDARERADLKALVDQMHKTLAEFMALTIRVHCRADDGKSESGAH
jgi:hypothetical protein